MYKIVRRNVVFTVIRQVRTDVIHHRASVFISYTLISTRFFCPLSRAGSVHSDKCIINVLNHKFGILAVVSAYKLSHIFAISDEM